mgnify:FL=1
MIKKERGMRMKKLKIIVASMLLVLCFGSVFASAYNNTYYQYWFQMDNEKEYSDPVVKEADGDPKYYVTTVDSYNQVPSDVFPNGGTFYCRAKWYPDRYSSTVYSYLLTFTSNTAKNAYYNEDEQYIRWNGQYCLRAEIEGAYYGWDERIQNVRWCP